MRGVHLFMIILLIPAILALGHDIYLFTQNSSINEATQALQDQDEGIRSFFADTGFLWTEYSPNTYKATVESLDPEQWAKVNKILAHKAVLVALAFAGIFYALLLLLKILGVWPFRRGESSGGGRKSKGKDDILSRGKSEKFKYKRK